MDDCQELSQDTLTEKRQPNASSRKTPPLADRRRERLQDLQAEACEEPDSLRASICCAAAELFEIGYLISTAIKETLPAGTSDLRAIADVMPAISSLAAVHRQASRYVQFERDWAAEQDTRLSAQRRRSSGGKQVGKTKD